MRRGLAALIMGLSLVVASASWAGFILSRTVLDPGRSERLADNLLDNEEVRATIVDRLADSVESQIPTEVPVTRETIEAAAAIALDDPRVESLIRDGIVRTHQNAINGVDEPVMIDASALGEAGRDAIIGLRPELDGVLPTAPPLAFELPSAGFSWLGAVKQWVDRFTLIGAVVSLVGIVLSFVVARNRAAVLRRVAYWAFGASFFWLAVAYGAPLVLARIAPSSVAIAMAAVDVFLGAMIRPALTLAGVGVALLVASLVWPAVTRRRPAAQLDRAARQRRDEVGRHPRGRVVVGPSGPYAAPPPAGTAVGSRGAPTAPPADHRPPPRREQGPVASPPAYDPTARFPVIVSGRDAAAPPPPVLGHDASRFDEGPTTIDRPAAPDPSPWPQTRLERPPAPATEYDHPAAPSPWTPAASPGGSGPDGRASWPSPAGPTVQNGGAGTAPATGDPGPAGWSPDDGLLPSGRRPVSSPWPGGDELIGSDDPADLDDGQDGSGPAGRWVEGVGYVDDTNRR
ncbi:MAG: hypothetical protein ACFCVK_06605 [Acidimicrobiales bacterium]